MTDTSELREAKAALRARMIAARDAWAPEVRAAAGDAIRERLLALPEWAGAGTLFLYVSFRAEIDTRGLLAAAFAAGRRVLVPRVERARREIEAYETLSLDDLVPGQWGILEPGPEARPADPAEIDLVVAPGLAFDAHGGRLGYGAGYYDRYLRRTRPDCTRAGIAYEAQMVPEVPCGPDDERMHLVITEAGVHRIAD